MSERPRILHVITGLARGGAESMLSRLLGSPLGERYEAAVVSLMDRGELGEQLEEAGVPVFTLGLKRRLPTPAGMLLLRRHVRRFRPRLLQGWMYHGNLAAWAASTVYPGVRGFRPRGAREIPVVWNIRQTVRGMEDEKATTRWAIRSGARLSPRIEAVVFNSEASLARHEELGYRGRSHLWIPNGFDLERFRPDEEARRALREELDLEPEAPLVGLIARHHPIKDHGTFLGAAAALRETHPQAHFVLAGRDVAPSTSALVDAAEAFGLAGHVHLLGERPDVARLTAALDVATSSSLAESFSNVVGEAMACGVPCAVTDVGDSARIVGDTGVVVPPADPEALAAAWRQLLDFDPASRREVGEAARERIVSRFSLEVVAERYRDLYDTLLRGELPGEGPRIDAAGDAPESEPEESTA